MTPELIEAAINLADLLEAENAALTALDLPRAAGMLAAKNAAVATFREAQARARTTPVSRKVAEEVGQKLGAAAEANRKLLERAITVQGRVLETIARAARTHTAPPQYGRRGRPMATSRPGAISLSASA
jgi:hypothetical protein